MSTRKTCKVVVRLFYLGALGIAQASIAQMTIAQTMPQTPRHVAVHAGHVLDVKTGKLLADQTLVIEDGKIISSVPRRRRRFLRMRYASNCPTPPCCRA